MEPLGGTPLFSETTHVFIEKFLTMKFGTQLSNLRFPEWKFYYVDYDELKQLLKTGDNEFAETHESVFLERLESELQKVFLTYTGPFFLPN
jgi:hypothetical protein